MAEEHTEIEDEDADEDADEGHRKVMHMHDPKPPQQGRSVGTPADPLDLTGLGARIASREGAKK